MLRVSRQATRVGARPRPRALLHVVFAVVLGGFAFLARPSQSEAEFTSEAVDTAPTDVASPTSLRLDADGAAHVAYFKNPFTVSSSVTYATNASGAWVRETVGDDGEYCSLVLDAAGAPHISYAYGGPSSPLYYAYKSGGSWTTEEPDTAVAIWTSIAMNAQGVPSIAYVWGETLAELRIARKPGGIWNVHTLDTNTQALEYVAHVVDANDDPHVAYKRVFGAGSTVRYAYRSGGAWFIETVDDPGSSEGDWLALAADDTGTPHLSYLTSSGRLRYARKSDGSWLVETVENVGSTQGTSIAIDLDGNPHITYDDLGHLTYALKSAGSWSIETVDMSANSTGQFSSLVIDADDNPRVAHFDDTADDVLYAIGVNPTGVGGGDGDADGVRDSDGAAGLAGGSLLEARPSVFASGGVTILFRVADTGAGASAAGDAVEIDLAIFDVAGRRVTTLASLAAGALSPGEARVNWDGRDDAGRALASGVYFARLTSRGAIAATARVTLVR
ncbi:MAG: FlgD immunoglobulin-like domain containing protein [bacterium]